MIATAQVDLRGRPTWDTGVLISEDFHWPTDAPVVPLLELVIRVAPGSVVEAGAQVITPASLDPMSGGVRRRSQRYAGSVFQVGRDLQMHDLLVPASPDAPVLLITERLRGALVSSRFTALRPAGGATPLWIWAVLNSMSGRNLRLRHSLGSVNTGVGKERLLDLAIPVAPLALQSSREPNIRVIESSTHIEEEQAPSTWWRHADLRGHEWRLLLASPQPERLSEGAPLASYANKIEQGGPRERGDDTDQPGAGMTVTDIGVLRGRPARRWARSLGRSGTMSGPGDVLIAAVGSRAYASVATEMSVVDRNVIRVALGDPRQAKAIARYLNGSAGYGLRQMLLRGSTVPHLSVRDLSRMPIPAQALSADSGSGPSIPLALQLEHALWMS